MDALGWRYEVRFAKRVNFFPAHQPTIFALCADICRSGSSCLGDVERYTVFYQVLCNTPPQQQQPNRTKCRAIFIPVFSRHLRRLIAGSTANGGSGGGGGFSNGSTLPRCERPVSSVVCMHLDPPPVIEGSDSEGQSSSSSSSSAAATAGAGAASTNGDGDDWNSGWDSSSGGGSSDKEDARLQWEQELCGGNSTGNGTSLWEHLDDVEESLLRYKVRRLTSPKVKDSPARGKHFVVRSACVSGGDGD